MDNSDAVGVEKVGTDDAAAYLSTLQHRFAYDREKYDEFLNVMMDYKHQRFDKSLLVERLKEILKGHNDLLLGFITFLPQSCKVTVPPPNIPRQVPFPNESRDSRDLCAPVFLRHDLFHNHPDLLPEFTQFLPESFV